MIGLVDWILWICNFLMNCSIEQSLNSKRTITIGQDNDLSEFDESRDIIESLVDEYKACESPDYIKWGMEVSTPVSFKCFISYKV